MNLIGHILQAIKHDVPLPLLSLEESSSVSLSPDPVVPPSVSKAKQGKRLCCSALQKQSDWLLFQKSEFNQLNKYQRQDMFGDPVPRPKPSVDDPNPMILDWVWDYSYKLDPVTLKENPKSRGTCNGSQMSDLEETFASCLEQTVHRLFWSIVALLNLQCLGCDVANAFSEAPKPKRLFYMRVDPPFLEWWTKFLKKPPIPLVLSFLLIKTCRGTLKLPASGISISTVSLSMT